MVGRRVRGGGTGPVEGKVGATAVAVTTVTATVTTGAQTATASALAAIIPITAVAADGRPVVVMTRTMIAMTVVRLVVVIATQNRL